MSQVTQRKLGPLHESLNPICIIASLRRVGWTERDGLAVFDPLLLYENIKSNKRLSRDTKEIVRLAAYRHGETRRGWKARLAALGEQALEEHFLRDANGNPVWGGAWLNSPAALAVQSGGAAAPTPAAPSPAASASAAAERARGGRLRL